MRVLHVYKSYFPEDYGGVAQAIRQLANGCSKYDVISTVFCLGEVSKRFQFEQHKVVQVRAEFVIASTPFSLAALFRFKELVDENDVIHFHYPFPFADLLKLMGGVKKPCIVTYHSDIVRQRVLKYFYYPLQEWFLCSVDQIVCTSEKYLESSRVLERYKEKTISVSLGIDEMTFLKSNSETSDKWKNFIATPFLLFLGALRDYKGIDTLVEAAKSSKATVLVAGGGTKLETYRNKIKKLGVTNVIFLGKVEEEDKSALLQLCEGLVLPSHLRSEAFGLVLLEAAIHEKPVICTELGTGTSFVNLHNKTGLVIQAKNVVQLRNALDFFVDQPEVLREMGKNARLRYLEHFTASKMCADYLPIYQSVTKGLLDA